MNMFKNTLTIIGLTAAMTLSAAAHSAVVIITGLIVVSTGSLASLLPPGTAFSGSLDWGGSTLDGGQVVLGGLCFTDDASGLPPISGTCGALPAVPILPTGESVYDGTPAAPGSTFEQIGTTFDGTSGDLNILALPPTLGLPITITISFDNPDAGTVFADGGTLGTASGAFTVVPVPAAAWLFGSALLGLGVVKRKKA
jgi:hypothetical protein